ncbi:MAG: MBL fold metallo-hydrolase [Candidatus Aenigmatarchaeota archaeon]|nr:MAG: MBL fold metallo-hydrolase [Candidatus Aenigmarchaeota archaeon]
MEGRDMRIIFLGTGGGRFVVINQLRATGGWILEMDGEMFHIDPGPGALVRAKQHGIDLKKLTGVFVSHCHPDHYADAELVVEAMTNGVTKKRGIIVGNVYVIEGNGEYHRVFSKYHLDAVEKWYEVKAGDTLNLGEMKVSFVETRHTEPRGVGFVFKGSFTIGYTSDGEYFEGQEKFFKGCDYLILNCLRSSKVSWPGHMNASQAKELIEKTRPGVAILQHFGMSMLKGVAEMEAERISRETGVKVVAAKDGMVFELERKAENLRNFI